ncbi:unnamed protein product, partial [Rotaria magnacalcarata]
MLQVLIVKDLKKGFILLKIHLVTVATTSLCEVSNQFMCMESGRCIDKEKVCDSIVDCQNGDDERSCSSCTFDGAPSSLRGWIDVSKGSLMWKLRTNGVLAAANQGPPFDHTSYSPTGNYIECQAADRFHCACGSCIPKVRICDTTDDRGDHSDESSRLCASYQTYTFNISCCDWIHDNSAQFKWALNRGPSPSHETGPNRDHSTGYAPGQYAFIVASFPQLPGHTARLISRAFQPRKHQVVIWYSIV